MFIAMKCFIYCFYVAGAIRERIPSALDTEIIAELGKALATAGDWDNGRAARRSKTKNSEPVEETPEVEGSN
jgi:hypothetical protein